MDIKRRIVTASPSLKASIAFVFSSFFQQGMNIITVPIFTRIMTESSYGMVSIYNSWFSLINVIVTFSVVGGVINNAMQDFEDDRNGFLSTVLTLVSISVCIFYCGYILLKNHILEYIQLPHILMQFMFINFIFNTALGLWMMKERYDYKYKAILVVNVLTALISPIIAYFLITNKIFDTVIARVIGGGIFPLLINIIIFISIYYKGKKIINLKYWKYVLKFNIPLIPHYLSYIVLAQADRIMIVNFLGEDKAGIYSVAYSAGSVSTVLFTAINSSFIPWTYKLLKEKKYKQLEKRSSQLVIFGATWCLLFMLFGPEAIAILAPPSYYEAVKIIPPVVLGVYFTFIYSLFANVEFYYKKTVYIMIASVLGAIINIILNLIFIPKYGFIAAGYTTMIGYLTLCIVHYTFMRKIDKNPIYNIQSIIIISSILIILAMITAVCYNYFVLRYILILSLILMSLILVKFKYINVKNLGGANE